MLIGVVEILVVGWGGGAPGVGKIESEVRNTLGLLYTPSSLG